MRLKNFVVLGLLMVMLAAPTLAATRIRVATGPWGGVYFLVGTALAHLLSAHIRDTTAMAEPVTSSAHSLELIHRGEATIGLSAWPPRSSVSAGNVSSVKSTTTSGSSWRLWTLARASSR